MSLKEELESVCKDIAHFEKLLTGLKNLNDKEIAAPRIEITERKLRELYQLKKELENKIKEKENPSRTSIARSTMS